MKKKKPLLIPKLREALAAGDSTSTQILNKYAHPAVISGVMPALSAAFPENPARPHHTDGRIWLHIAAGRVAP